MDKFVSIEKVSMVFNTRQGAFTALQDIDLTIAEGEFVTLIGHSGCGKSTLLNLVAGLLKPASGVQICAGREISGPGPDRGVVFQNHSLLPWLTCFENVHLAVERVFGAVETKAQLKARTLKALDLVQLSRSAHQRPNEISGGMKQRVGMARALAVEPEILFMDEPFSQVDALTAETLRAEVLDIWSAKERSLSSILMVSHDIKEVAFMADRIIVLGGAHPARVRKVVENELPRPRDYRAPELLRLVDQLYEIITGSELPDVPAGPPTPEPEFVEPLPPVSAVEIVGLLEYLDLRGGQDDIFRIATATNREFGKVITIVKAAEMLNFVDTPKRTVLLEPLGKRFVRGAADERQRIWRDQLLSLHLVKEIYRTLKRQRKHKLDRDFILETIVIHMPQENYEQVFETLVGWARFGDLFHYDETTGVISLEP